MKELEKTKRISISTVVFMLVLVVGFLTFRKPKNVYKKTYMETLGMLKTQDYLIAKADLDPAKNTIIDIRNNFEYSKSHINKAINIQTAEILDESNITLFDELRNAGTTVVLYGTNPNEASSAWMLLYQLGYDNIKILNVEGTFKNNTLEIKDYNLEKPITDFSKIFSKAYNDTLTKEKANVPKKITIRQKKKKRKPEGGC